MTGPTEEPQNLPEALASEIKRVTEILGIYKKEKEDGSEHLEFAIALMELSIREGVKASGSNDIQQMIFAIRSLQLHKEYEL